ncbi:MAG: cytoplasmic protein [Pseudomonadota bacterium]
MFENELDKLNLKVDTTNMYMEEGFTDLKVASIRRLTPIKADGTPDPSRTPIFVGTTQLLTPEGPLPIQAPLMANSLQEALEVFADAMKKAVADMMQEARRMKQDEASRIIVPGRG